MEPEVTLVERLADIPAEQLAADSVVAAPEADLAAAADSTGAVAATVVAVVTGKA